MRMLACCEEFLKEKKRSLSTSATRASRLYFCTLDTKIQMIWL